jgi:hypothetical protein
LIQVGGAASFLQGITMSVDGRSALLLSTRNVGGSDNRGDGENGFLLSVFFVSSCSNGAVTGS